MAEESAPTPPWKITDRDLRRLMRRGIREVADDPTAMELSARIQQRENVEEDREHRERSESSAALGLLAGMALLLVFIVGSVATFHP
ncbi:hypothetical protein ACF1A5_05360 [Streptomyces sp. NPDC014864]|uniref:hypothetical protein n=1 Tax=Streptomyces sp. NPDC014864 TaxID=3364924 RepID=UPI0036FCC6BE